jgi:hypothetical protein
MLLFIEIFDTIACIFVLAKPCLVLSGVKIGLIVPKLQHLDVHCWVKVRYQTSGAPLHCEGAAPTFVHSVGDLVEFTTVSLLQVGVGLGRVGGGEGRHCGDVKP